MSSPKPESAPCPNLIFIAPALGQLDVVACQETLRDLKVLWHERRPLPEQALLHSRLAEICKRHALVPDTRAILIVPPGAGGLFSHPAPLTARTKERWRQHQLELSVPYPSTEIRYQVRCTGDLAQFFWIPTAWLDNQKILFGKLGLNLAEVYPRTSLVENSPGMLGHEGVLCEKFEQDEYLYELTGGRVSQAALLQAGTDSQVRKTYLGAMRNGCDELVITLPQELSDWEGCLPALWREPELAIPVTTRPLALWVPFSRVATAMLLILAGFAGTLNWQITTKEEALTKVTRERKALADSAKRFSVLERTRREEGATLAAMKRINAAPTPLALLAHLTGILPNKAWIQEMVFDGKSIVVSGKGIGDDDLINLLQNAGLPAEKMRQEPMEAGNDFRLRVNEKHAPAEVANGGAS